MWTLFPPMILLPEAQRDTFHYLGLATPDRVTFCSCWWCRLQDARARYALSAQQSAANVSRP